MASRNLSRVIVAWNTKLHIYVGLFSLLFLWLFAVSGVIMNHPLLFGAQPTRSEFEQPVELPLEKGDQATAEALIQQLGISGEIVFIVPKKDHLTFRVNRPHRRIVVDVDLQTRIARVRTAIPGVGGVLLSLHTATGVRTIWNEPEPHRDWVMTKIWSFCMDAICAGLIFLVPSSIYMWYQLKQKRLLGSLVLSLGTLTCAFFMWGLSWMP